MKCLFPSVLRTDSKISALLLYIIHLFYSRIWRKDICVRTINPVLYSNNGRIFLLSVKSLISCANGNVHSPGLVISRCVACVLAIHAQVLGVGRKGLRPRPARHVHGNTQATHSWWTARGQEVWNKHHKSKPASISGNNHGLGCTNETVSMSVCIHIKGFDGKWWQE